MFGPGAPTNVVKLIKGFTSTVDVVSKYSEMLWRVLTLLIPPTLAAFHRH